MKRVLVVEDENAQRETLYYLLKSYIPEVEFDICENGDDAIKKFAEREYFLVIVDLHLGKGGLQGRDVIGTVRKTSNVPIIVITGTEYPFHSQEYKSLKVQEYNKKPIKASDLEKLVRKYLGLTLPDAGVG